MLSLLERILNRIIFSNKANHLLRKNGKHIQDIAAGEKKKIFNLLQRHQIDLVLDVGANRGQYAGFLRSMGYTGAIISFEPVNASFLKLQKRIEVEKDELVTCLQIALGDEEKEAVINVTQNLESSSILELKDVEYNTDNGIFYTSKEKINVKTLDSIFTKITEGYENVFLKLDVQGYEKNVLRGAETSLQFIKGIQIEMSFEELYKGEMLFNETIDLLKEKKFMLCALKNGFSDSKTGKLLQVDGFFFK